MHDNIFIFKQNNKDQWHYIQDTLEIELLRLRTEGEKDFQVMISEVKKEKTPKQLRGLHKLIKIISAQLIEWGELEYNEDVVKQIIKHKCGYVKEVKGIMVVKSFKDIKLEEIKKMIEFTIAWGQAELGIAECFLTPQEVLDINLTKTVT